MIAKTNSAFFFFSMSHYFRSRAHANQELLFASPMSKAWLILCLRLLCQYCCLHSERDTGHSFRIGAATKAAPKTPISTLKAMGRWSSAPYECPDRKSKRLGDPKQIHTAKCSLLRLCDFFKSQNSRNYH